ncbi:MAG: cadherin-like beta sandwich domain-containing protein [Clostridia bacterium]|nr:cadherin-like beta sandwich domain-containing protein [Clostridia bacterium]
MKTNFKIGVIVLLIIAIIIPFTRSYATAEKSFFRISKEEVTKNEKIEMTINIENIPYEKSIFELNSNQNLENIEIQSNVEAEQQANQIIINLNKAETNLNTITLFYDIPTEQSIGDTLKFVATITNAENSEEKETVEENVRIIEETIETNEVNEIVNNTVQDNNVASINIVNNNVVNNNVENNTIKDDTITKPTLPESDKDKEDDIEDMTKPEDEEEAMNKEKVPEKKTKPSETEEDEENEEKETISKASNITSASTENVVTYNGSDNNYLNSLVVDGYDLNKTFSKDNSTYFINVAKDTESIKITATAEETTAKVCIYGNADLSNSSNKILISVTAENGNVRNYRIYVNKNT